MSELPDIELMAGEFFDVEIAHKLGDLPPDGFIWLRKRYVEDVRANDIAASQVTDWWLGCNSATP